MNSRIFTRSDRVVGVDKVRLKTELIAIEADRLLYVSYVKNGAH